MSTDPVGTVYVVSIFDEGEWRRLLTTQDEVEAESLRAAMEQDGVEALLEKFEPKAKAAGRAPPKER